VEDGLRAAERARTFTDYTARRMSIAVPSGFTPDEGGPRHPIFAPELRERQGARGGEGSGDENA